METALHETLYVINQSANRTALEADISEKPIVVTVKEEHNYSGEPIHLVTTFSQSVSTNADSLISEYESKVNARLLRTPKAALKFEFEVLEFA